jgi:hypothetical protein
MATIMLRLTLAALALLTGCGQDIDLGNSRMSATEGAPPPAGPSTKAAAPGCPFEDPAMLVAPQGCPEPFDGDPFTAICVVTAAGPVRARAGELPTVPACPTGVYFSLSGELPPAENIERALLALKGKDGDKPAFTAEMGMAVARTVERLADRGAFFVRLDPRPSAGLRINVIARYDELYRGLAVNPGGESYGYVFGFHAGTPDIP